MSKATSPILCFAGIILADIAVRVPKATLPRSRQVGEEVSPALDANHGGSSQLLSPPGHTTDAI
ncbi:hypothetical protein ACWJJH_14915 [Endozoicomonadaceae bacterium StTr2]